MSGFVAHDLSGSEPSPRRLSRWRRRRITQALNVWASGREMLRELRMKRFEEVYDRWRRRRITQALAANVLGVTARTFRRWVVRYEAGGLAALKDKRVAGPAHRRAPPGEVAALDALYRDGYRAGTCGTSMKVYVREHGGSRSYTWLKNRLQEAGLVKKGRRKGPHRERKPASGMMLHQDASTHEWVGGERWDLVVTMDDATGEVLSGFFVEEEGTWPSLWGVGETVEAKGLFDSPVHGPGLALLAHAEGGREGGPRTTRPSSAGRWASWGTRDDCRVLAAGAGPERAVLRNASGAAAAGAGSTGRSRCRRRRRRARSPLCSPP